MQTMFDLDKIIREYISKKYYETYSLLFRINRF
jgi:hypothetical protein